MAEQEVKKPEPQTTEAPAAAPEVVEPPPPKIEVLDEKTVAPPQPDESKTLTEVDKPKEDAPKKISGGGSLERDVALANVEKERQNSFIKAWEESEKTKAENKAQKKLSAVVSSENSQKAALEADLRKFEEKQEKQKAENAEKMRNRIALIHKQAEEKKAIVEAKRREETLKAEEMAAKYRATGQTPKKLLGCF